MKIWGLTKKYKALSWWENFMGGHTNIGPVTIFGANAMNWAVNIRTKKWGYICFTLPVLARFRRRANTGKLYFDWYFYLSPNGTPWAATFYIGTISTYKRNAKVRLKIFGHGFDSNKKRDELYKLNQMLE